MIALRTETEIETETKASSDSELVADFLATGRPEPFETLVERYQARVFRLALSIMGRGGEADAEEVAQEVFVTVYRNLSTFRQDSQFGTWLYRITYRKGIDRYRHMRWRRAEIGEEALDPLPSAEDLQASAERAEEDRRLACAVESLPDLYRTVIQQHYWLGASVAEIGETLEAPVGTVKSYLFRARKRLAKILGQPSK